MARTTHRIAVLDVETTGFSGADRIIEIGIITFDSRGQEEERYETLIQPDRDIPNSFVHGISATLLADAPRFAEVAGRIAELLDDHVVVAHNASFDTRMLNQEFSRLGHTLTGTSIWFVDTMRLSQFLLPGRPSKLADALAVVGITNDAAHNALADAVATARLYYELVDRGAMIVAHPLVMPAGALQLGTVASLPRPVRTGQRETDAYQEVLIAALDDGLISDDELNHLVAKATELGLTLEEAHGIHVSMLGRMVMLAWADGELTDDEAGLIRQAARSLQVEPEAVEDLLSPPRNLPGLTLAPGSRISFTGALELSRESWESRVLARGFTIGGVTKKSVALVAADLESRSGKAVKARRYGVPIISESHLAWLLHQTPEQASSAPTINETTGTGETGEDLTGVFPWLSGATTGDPAGVANHWINEHPTTPLFRMSSQLSEGAIPEGLDDGRLSVKRWLSLYPRPLTACVQDLRDLTGWGEKSVADAVQAVVTTALDNIDGADGGPAAEPDGNHPDNYGFEVATDPYSPAVEPNGAQAGARPQSEDAADPDPTPAPASDTDRLAEWFALCKIPVSPRLTGAPDEVMLAAQRIDDHGEATRLHLAQQLTEEIHSALQDDARLTDIMHSRVLAQAPDTLEAVGQRWEVTRERIRQLEKQLRTRLGEIVHTHLAALPHRIPRPVRAAKLLHSEPDLATDCYPGTTLLDVLLALSDDVVRRGDWIEQATAHQELEEVALSATDHHGVLAWEALSGIGPVDDADRAQWVTSLADSWVLRDGRVFTRTREYGDRGIAVLSVTRTPMTSQEIIDYLGHGSTRSLDNALARDERAHRISRGTWGLVEWGGDEFTTVADWIAARVDVEGSYPLADLLREADDLGVSGTTVRTYCSNGEFIIEEEQVVRNTEPVDVETNPEEHASMFLRDGAWQLLITVTHDHLRGSGFSVPRSLVGLFEVPFLGGKVFRSALGDQELKFGRTNTHTGSIRRFLQELGSREGDRLWVHFGEDGMFSVSPATERADVTWSAVPNTLAEVLNYCGMDDRGDDLATLNRSLGLAPDAPRRQTVSRFNHRREEALAEVVRGL